MGCCGSKRQQMAQTLNAQGRRLTAGLGPDMREQAAIRRDGAQPTSGSHAPYAAPSGVPFIYDGMAELVVTGSATGRRYRFAARGARLMADALDAPALRLIPKLRCLA